MAAMNRTTLLLIAALRMDAAYNRLEDVDHEWAARQRQADHDHVLQPPAPRGYGYMYVGEMVDDAGNKYWVDDFKSLGIDPAQDRQHDLKRWAHDLDLAVEAGLITQHEGEAAVKRAIT